ncbi:MAG: sugar ABC transporter permease [Clostridiales bacterium]|nr:sugar ABC transporter permease [Clostridiales bacterium]
MRGTSTAGARLVRAARRDWRLHAMMLLPLAWLIIFCYVPMYGAQIAFRKYLAADGIWGSEWAGLSNFQKFFSNFKSKTVIWNALRISLYSLAAGFPAPILLALLINACPFARFRKTVQLITYAPYFISTVVMVGMVLQFLSPTVGLYGQITKLIGARNPVNILAKPQYFDHVYVLSGIWQGTGYGAIIYIAALSGVDPSLYEAATIDGASRFQKILFIDVPSIMPTAAILLILNMGSLMNVGFEKIYLLQNNLNMSASEVISTYVYKTGIGAGLPDYSYSTAVGLFNSVISCVLVVSANALARRMGSTSLW